MRENNLILALKDLLDHWRKEFYKWYDLKFHDLLKMKKWIQHEEIKITSKHKLFNVNMYWIFARENGRPAKNLNRFLIIITRDSYEKYVKKSIKITIEHEWKNDEEENMTWKQIWRKAWWARAIRDEFHLKNNFTSFNIKIWRNLNTFEKISTTSRCKIYHKKFEKLDDKALNYQKFKKTL